MLSQNNERMQKAGRACRLGDADEISRRIEQPDERPSAVELRQEIGELSRLLDAVEHHLGAGHLCLGIAVVVGHRRFIPDDARMILDAERTRLDKELKRVDGELAKSRGKLANDTFVANAPAAVVEQERQRLAEWTAQHAALAAQRAKL